MLIALEEHGGSVTVVVLVIERPPDTPVPIGLTRLEYSQRFPALNQLALEGKSSSFSQQNLDRRHLFTGEFANQGERHCTCG